MDYLTYLELLSRQGGRCAICGMESCSTNRAFAVDHCHDTGKIRGLLCFHCNTGLGKFKDSPELIQSAHDYLINSTRPTNAKTTSPAD